MPWSMGGMHFIQLVQVVMFTQLEPMFCFERETCLFKGGIEEDLIVVGEFMMVGLVVGEYI